MEDGGEDSTGTKRARMAELEAKIGMSLSSASLHSAGKGNQC